MKIIEQIILQTEKKLNLKIKTTQEKIDFNPFTESISIHNDLVELISLPIDDLIEHESKLNDLKIREAKNNRDKKRVMKPNYVYDLYNVLNDLESQKRDLFSFKMYVNFKDE